MITATGKNESNRRDFFRINQDLILDVRPVDAYEANNADAEAFFETGDSLSLTGELRRINHQAAQSLKVLAEKDSQLGDYLQLLSQKIDLIARHTILSHSKPEPHAHRRINLSEAGLAFRSDKPYYTGKFLALRMVFLPDYIPLILFAEVIRCDHRHDGTQPEAPQREEFEIAARFYRLKERDRQELARQIMKAQVAHRKQSGPRKSVRNP